MSSGGKAMMTMYDSTYLSRMLGAAANAMPVIHGYAGTTAEKSAKNSGFPFEAIPEDETPGLAGDLTGDGEVTVQDAVAFAQYLAEVESAIELTVNADTADLDGDGIYTLSDLDVLLKMLTE